MSELDLPDSLLLLPAACYGLAAVLALFGRRVLSSAGRSMPSLFLILGGILGALVAVDGLRDDGAVEVAGWAITPFAELSFRLDPLAAFFLLVISVPAVAAAWYGLGYLDASHHGHDREPRAATDALLGLFLAAMSLVVLADNVITFLIAWELMSLVSFFLVIGDGRHADARRAGYIYVVMTHIATGFLLLAFLALLRNGGALDFETFRTSASSLSGLERHAVFLLALLGFGTKAGLIPLHVWLPHAHPAAPSHVSALMSGVMVKTAIYGLLRVLWEFTEPGPGWWGALLIGLGIVSAVLGILYALMERDLKRILAYSTVEHVGIITIGLGTALMLESGGHAELAALALVATLVHLFNHSIFKSLLFLVAGAVQTATGTRDLERLGGLIRGMPRTAIWFIIGALAIAALPPLNGFAGEWLLFQSLIGLGSVSGSASTATLVALAAAGLALTGALALACFVRAAGTGFLAQHRSEAAREAREVGLSMHAGMALLGAGCVGLGLFPVVLFRALRPVTLTLAGTTVQPSLGLRGHVLNPESAAGSYAPILIVAGLVLLGIVPWLAARLLTGKGRTRVAPTWVCGVELEPRMQYSATAFAKPIRLIFQELIRPHRLIELERPVSSYFVAAVRYEEGVHPIYERHLYERAVRLLTGASHRISRLQSGSIRAYLLYVFVTLVVVLLLTR
jgi:hydrogenase-4 component B